MSKNNQNSGPQGENRWRNDQNNQSYGRSGPNKRQGNYNNRQGSSYNRQNNFQNNKSTSMITGEIAFLQKIKKLKITRETPVCRAHGPEVDNNR